MNDAADAPVLRVRDLKKHFDVTVNDVVLSAAAGTLGVSVEELQAILPAPPEGGPGG